MKLISLNLWGGIVHDPLIAFVREHARDADIFCLQELFFGKEPIIGKQGQHEDISEEIRAILSDFVIYPMLAALGSRFQDEQLKEGLRIGQAIFVRKGIEVVDRGEFYTYLPDSAFAKDHNLISTGNCNYVRIRRKVNDFVIATMHGVWQEQGKGDTPDRIEQSKIVSAFLKTIDCPKILCGDFNMLPNTESMAILEAVGMKNLIKEYGITTTRSSFYTKATKFADYVLISPEITVKSFEVPSRVVSDHLPMILDFEN